jgi:hypothetical protein
VFGHAEEQPVRQLTPIVEDGDTPRGIQGRHPAVGEKPDPALGEGLDQRFGGIGRWRHRARERKDQGDLTVGANTPLAEVVVQHQHGLARGGRAFVGRAADADERRALGERGQHSAQMLGAGDRVVLVTVGDEARRGFEVIVSAQRHHDEVRVVGAGVGTHSAGNRVDRGDCLATATNARLDNAAVGQPDRLWRGVPEHHVELRVAEDERIALVDQGHLRAVAQRLRYQRGEL